MKKFLAILSILTLLGISALGASSTLMSSYDTNSFIADGGDNGWNGG